MRQSELKVVSVLDPALHVTSDQMVEYIKSRKFELVVNQYVAGKRPTIFVVNECPHGLWESYVMNVPNDSLRNRRAFIACVSRVDNLRQDDGTVIDSWEPSGKVDGRPQMTEEECDARFAPYEREEIGAVAFMHSFLHRRTDLELRLPSSVLGLLGGRVFRPVEPSRSTASAETSGEPLAATTQSPDMTASASESAVKS